MSNSRRKFLCLDCRVDTGKIREHYMLVDDVWFSIHGSNLGMICIGCIENRLGRQLCPQDFNSSHVNNPKLYDMSARLLSRITRN
jgi:hypothetical protein